MEKPLNRRPKIQRVIHSSRGGKIKVILPKVCLKPKIKLNNKETIHKIERAVSSQEIQKLENIRFEKGNNEDLFNVTFGMNQFKTESYKNN